MKKPSFFIPAIVFSAIAHGAIGGLMLWEYSRSPQVPWQDKPSVVWMRLNAPEEHPAAPEGCRSAAGTTCGQNVSRAAADTRQEPRTEEPALLEPAIVRQNTPIGSEGDQDAVSTTVTAPSVEESRPSGEESRPDPAEEGEKQRIVDDFLRQVRLTIEKNKDYPWRARLAGMEGTVTMEFVLGEDGKARRIRIVRSSGYPLLDESAVGTIDKISRFPEIPEALHLSEIALAVPLIYQIEKE
ncbi:MAG: energy transducer TonB [Nitrospirae bacterium]|nr:energy transducer TonB [Nitrospirota bacterium]